ncbi:hypothetical protein L916_12861 [Phytophthora nicotianae]|uniref:Uncharacterized protein n=1 Tax=Phytophthora nicotianae TaxID=4792 RepID=W2IN52_PHYNI|nr:hypothetical protein L916_12861 [Phytophthora nicotianae]
MANVVFSRALECADTARVPDHREWEQPLNDLNPNTLVAFRGLAKRKRLLLAQKQASDILNCQLHDVEALLLGFQDKVKTSQDEVVHLQTKLDEILSEVTRVAEERGQLRQEGELGSVRQLLGVFQEEIKQSRERLDPAGSYAIFNDLEQPVSWAILLHFQRTWQHCPGVQHAHLVSLAVVPSPRLGLPVTRARDKDAPGVALRSQTPKPVASSSPTTPSFTKGLLSQSVPSSPRTPQSPSIPTTKTLTVSGGEARAVGTMEDSTQQFSDRGGQSKIFTKEAQKERGWRQTLPGCLPTAFTRHAPATMTPRPIFAKASTQ